MNEGGGGTGDGGDSGSDSDHDSESHDTGKSVRDGMGFGGTGSGIGGDNSYGGPSFNGGNSNNINSLTSGGPPSVYDSYKSLADMYNKQTPTTEQLTREQINTLNGIAPAERSWFDRMNIHPGMSVTEALDRETPAERADRMGMIGNAIGTVGNAFIGAAMPAPMAAGLTAYGAWNNYKNGMPGQQALGQAIGGLPGYFGAVGNAMQGNWGNALTGFATKSGMLDRGTAMALGLGLDASQGKNVNGQLGGLAGQFAGSRLGGPVGGVFGQRLGTGLANMYGRKG